MKNYTIQNWFMALDCICEKATGNRIGETDEILACYWAGMLPQKAWDYLNAIWQANDSGKENFCPIEH